MKFNIFQNKLLHSKIVWILTEMTLKSMATEMIRNPAKPEASDEFL